jgi:hypothetical protein
MCGFALSHLNRCAMRLRIGEGGAPTAYEGGAPVGHEGGAPTGYIVFKSIEAPGSSK